MSELWQHIGLLGRDSLLAQKIHPRIRSREKRFLLRGEAGSGKTAILQWCQAHTPNSVLISAAGTYANIVKAMIDAWQIESESAKVADLEELILATTGKTLYVDDLHRANPKLLALLKTLSERHRISGSILTGVKLKEDLKQVLWGMEHITLTRLHKDDALRLAEKACVQLASRASYRDVAAASRGLPGRIVSFAASGEAPREQIHLRTEEIDISPVFLLSAVVIIALRLLGRAINATDLSLIGGASVIVLMGLRMFLQKGKEK